MPPPSLGLGLGLQASHARVAGSPFVLGKTYADSPGTACTIPLPDGVTDPYHQIHPSIQFFPNGFGGWKYWLACCPYHGGDGGVDDENPCVYVSNDGITFEEPAGLTNPIATAPPVGEGGNNADQHLYWDAIGQQFVLTWLRSASNNEWSGTAYVGKAYQSVEIKAKTSTDGITWSDTLHLWQGNIATYYNASPSLMRLSDGSWRMWMMNQVPDPNIVEMWECATLTGSWTIGAELTYDNAPTNPWHLEVRKYGNLYVMLLNDKLAVGYDLKFLTSSDGIAWAMSAAYPYAAANLAGVTATPPSASFYKSGFVLGPWFGAGTIGRIWLADAAWQFINVAALAAPPASHLPDTEFTTGLEASRIFDKFLRGDGNLVGVVPTSGGVATWGLGSGTSPVIDTAAVKRGAANGAVIFASGSNDGIIGARFSVLKTTSNVELAARWSVGNSRLELYHATGVWRLRVYNGAGAAWVNLASFYRYATPIDLTNVEIVMSYQGANVQAWYNSVRFANITLTEAQLAYTAGYAGVGFYLNDTDTRVDRFFARP